MITIYKRWAGLVAAPSDTNENTLATIVLPSGIIPSVTSALQVTTLWEVTNNGNVKTFRLKLGSTTANSNLLTSTAQAHVRQTIYFNNALNSQIVHGTLNGYSVSGSALSTITVDFSSAVTLTLTMQKATGSDTVNLRGYEVAILTQDELLTGKVGATLDSQPTYNLYTFTDGRTRRKDWKKV